MPCPVGQHEHMGSKGKMLRCHPISTKHTNERTRQYHEMAIAEKRNSNMDEDLGIEQEQKISIPPEKLERIGYPLRTEKKSLPVWEKSNSFRHDGIHGKTVLPEHYRHGIM